MNSVNADFLNTISSNDRDFILKSIANHYGITSKEALAEVTREEAEWLLEYMVEPARSATWRLMKDMGFCSEGEINSATNQEDMTITPDRQQHPGVEHFEVRFLNQPTENIRGVVTLVFPVTRLRGERQEKANERIALATLYTDKPPSLLMTIPSAIRLEDLPELGTALQNFHAKVNLEHQKTTA